jgi:pimeloyl-ACP methyl ester carboxylesterase
MLSSFSLIALIVVAIVLSIIGWGSVILYLRGFLYKKTEGPGLAELTKQNYRTIFGHQVFYSQEGQGEHILLLHGIGASHYVWRFIVPQLAKDHTVTAVDLLGFGLSDKPNTFKYDLDSQCEVILQLVKELKIEKCTLIGSSMGGTISLRLVQMHPEIFQKIVVLSPAADPKIVLFDLNRVSFLSPMVMPLVTERFVKQILRMVYSERRFITDENIKIYSDPYSNNPSAIESFVKSFSLLKDPRVLEELELIKNPVLILWGRKDRIVSSKLAPRLQSKILNSTLEIHETGGHHIQEEDPDWVLSKIISFLSS